MSYQHSEEFSPTEFRTKLFHKFKKEGVFDSLKTQLRVKVLQELHPESTIQNYGNNTDEEGEEKCLEEKGVDALIADYLQVKKYDYTLSVFIPETRYDSMMRVTHRDILRMLGMDTSSIIADHMLQLGAWDFKGGRQSLIKKIIDFLATYSLKKQKDMEIQTESFGDSRSLLENLQKIDEEFTQKFASELQEAKQNFEGKLEDYHKEIEKRYKKDLETEISRFKKMELEKIKADERQNYEKELDHLRKEMETVYHERVLRLSKKEEETRNLSNLLERERRKLEQQRETLHNQGLELRRQQDEMGEVGMLKETISSKDKSLNMMKKELNETRTLFKNLEEENEKLKQVQRQCQLLHRDVEPKSKTRREVQNELEKFYKPKLDTLQRQLREEKNKSEQLQDRADKQQQRIQNQKKEHESEISNYEEKIKQLQEHLNNVLSREKKSGSVNEETWLLERDQLMEEVKLEKNRSGEILRELEEEQVKNKSLRRETQNLKQMLQETRSALESSQRSYHQMETQALNPSNPSPSYPSQHYYYPREQPQIVNQYSNYSQRETVSFSPHDEKGITPDNNFNSNNTAPSYSSHALEQSSSSPLSPSPSPPTTRYLKNHQDYKKPETASPYIPKSEPQQNHDDNDEFQNYRDKKAKEVNEQKSNSSENHSNSNNTVPSYSSQALERPSSPSSSSSTTEYSKKHQEEKESNTTPPHIPESERQEQQQQYQYQDDENQNDQYQNEKQDQLEDQNQNQNSYSPFVFNDLDGGKSDDHGDTNKDYDHDDDNNENDGDKKTNEPSDDKRTLPLPAWQEESVESVESDISSFSLHRESDSNDSSWNIGGNDDDEYDDDINDIFDK